MNQQAPNKRAAQRVEEAAARVAETAEAVHSAARAVDSNVSRGIQPDVRELRLNVSELNALINLRLRWLTVGVAVSVLLSAIALLLQVT